jgi:hypothetical protein
LICVKNLEIDTARREATPCTKLELRTGREERVNTGRPVGAEDAALDYIEVLPEKNRMQLHREYTIRIFGNNIAVSNSQALIKLV